MDDRHRARCRLPRGRRAPARARVRHLRHRRALLLQRRPPDRGALGARPRDLRRGDRDRPARGGGGRGSGIAIGDAVHCISTLWCGRCRLCRSGAENLCLQRRADGLRPPGRVRRPRRDPQHRAQEPVPDPRRPVARARHLRRPAVATSSAATRTSRSGSTTRRRDRRRPGRHRPRRARAAPGRRPGADARARRAPARARARHPRRRAHRLRRHRARRTATRRSCARPTASAPTS